jgi:murein DD-endopeptidase / murein LD-carboxypeptidase
MGKTTKGIILIFSVLIAMYSSSNAQGTKTVQPKPTILEEYMNAYYSQVFGVDVTGILNTELYSTIEEWLNTPYRYAGKTINGIDCSGFVNKIYENVYCYFISGNAADLFKKVIPLSRDMLKEGDLVFFKINRKNISHVGLYLGNDKFVHASVGRGVIISDLNQPYYRKYFVKGGRVNTDVN